MTLGEWTMQNAIPPWLVVATDSRRVDLMLSEVRRAAGLLVTLDGSELRSESELFDKFAQSLRFPSYFGRNWDALEECLGDVYNWLRCGICVVSFMHPELILAQEPDSLETFLSVLHRSAEWIAKPISDEGVLNRPGVSLHFLFRTDRIGAAQFLHRIELIDHPEFTYMMID
jgi:RNAse (barnase) inhibitor barstar